LDKKEGYEFAETLLRRGREEVAVALGVDGDDYEYAEPRIWPSSRRSSRKMVSSKGSRYT
jgi:hypothetical protein